MGMRFGAGVMAIGLALALAGCGGAGDAADAAGPPEPVSVNDSSLDRETVVEAIQDEMLVALEHTYANRNASVRLEGSVVHVSMDGDAGGSLAGFSDCRVLSQAVRDTQTVMLTYPNGSIDCVELLSGMD